MMTLSQENVSSQIRANRIRVFVASPGDVADERNIVSLVVSEINRMLGAHLGCTVEVLRWETDARPGVGEDPQDVINRQIADYDIFVGVMWRRFGTPTKRAKSGTGEEFERALIQFKKHGRPTIMFYFRDEPFYTTNRGELRQFTKVAKFQDDLRKVGVLYWQYQSPLEFERYVREHLIRQLLAKLPQPSVVTAALTGQEIVSSTGSVRGASAAIGVGFASHLVFLAYQHPDEISAKMIYKELLAAGHRVWMDIEALLPGQMWIRELEEALRRSSAFVVLVSKQSSGDTHFIAKEFELAQGRLKQGLRVIVVRLDSTTIPQKYRNFQTVDFFLHDGLQRLLDALQLPPTKSSVIGPE